MVKYELTLLFTGDT